MRRTCIGLAVAIVCGSLMGCLHVPMPWSPDGSWLAYTVEVRPAERIMAPGWTFEVQAPSRRLAAPAPARYQIWATRAATNVSVLLEDSPGPLTSPGWSPDGHALAFGRVAADGDRPGCFEVVVLEGLARRRVVSSRPLGPPEAEFSRLPLQGIAWSPDSRYLAVPELQPSGLVVLRADDGRVVNSIPDAFLPSWSPVGGRLAFYQRSNGQALYYLDSAASRPRYLLDVGQASQAPIWGRDGESIAVVTRRANQKLGDAGADTIDLVRVRLDTAAIETIRSLSADAGPRQDRAVEGTSIAFDRDGENVFCSAPVEGRLNQLTWYRPRENAIFKKFTLVDPAIPIGSLSFSNDGRTLAARVAGGGRLMPPVLCEPEHGAGRGRTRLIAPDDPARLEWVATLVRTAVDILRGMRDGPGRSGTATASPADRPTILPLPDELQANPEAATRLRQLGRLGRPLCDRPAGSPDLDPTTDRVFAEARLFFDYLDEDYPAALRDLEAIESMASTPDIRSALLTVRAQILLGQGQDAGAKRVVDFLDRTGPASERRIEAVGDSYRLTPVVADGRGWLAYLADSAARSRAAAQDHPSGETTNDFPLRRVPPTSRPGPPGRGALPDDEQPPVSVRRPATPR